jgi:tetratricopeptide (TPR) repeat protein
VVKELRTTLLGDTPDSQTSGEAKAEVAHAAQGRSGNPESHRLYLEAVHFMERFTEDGVQKAMSRLGEALAADPANALARVAQGRGYLWQGAFGVLPPDEGARRAREAAEKALALVPEMAEAHHVLGVVQGMYEHDWAAGRKSLERALAIEPNNASVLSGIGQFAHYRGRFEDAERYYLRALEQDPLSSRLYSQIGNLYRVTGRLSEAERAYRKALELSPQRITAHHLLAIVLCLRGEYDAALAEANLEPAEWGRLTGLAEIYWETGRRAEADAALAELEARHAKDSAFQISAIHAMRGDVDAAFSWIERAMDENDQGTNLLACEPIFQPLHADSRWPVVLRRLGLAE